MNDISLVSKLVGFRPILKGSDAISSRKIQNRLYPYKWVLLFVDLLAVTFAISTINLIETGKFFIFSMNFPQFVNLFVFAIITLSFFSTYHLYNYHRIFNPRSHMILMFKSFIWSGLILFLILFMFQYGESLRGRYFIPFIFFLGFTFMILGRILSDQLLNVIKLLGISFVSLGIIGVLNYEESIEFLDKWQILIQYFILSIGFICAIRVFLVHKVFNKWLRSAFRKQVVIIGSNNEAETLTNHVIKQNAPFWVAGFVGNEESSKFEAPACKERLCDLKDLPSIVAAKGINELIITDEKIDKQRLISLLDYCTSEGLTVWFSPELMPIIEMKLYIDDFCGIPMIRLCSQKFSWASNKIKHGLDALITLPALLLLAPLFFVIGLIIKRDSPGPVFYRAKAIGRNGKEFIMYKFRSMKVDSGNDIHKEFVTKLIKGEIRKEDKVDGVLKITDDPRITSVGNLLRKTSMDELPQIINVIKGDMSLVGPRPCLPYEYEIYKDWHTKRLSVRPGITCLWQVAARSDVEFEDMVLLDLYYIYNRSMLMDLNILYETIFAVLAKKGAH